jgi:hypothetical protein
MQRIEHPFNEPAGNVNHETCRIGCVEQSDSGCTEHALTLRTLTGREHYDSSPRDREIYYDSPLVGRSELDFAGQASAANPHQIPVLGLGQTPYTTIIFQCRLISNITRSMRAMPMN